MKHRLLRVNELLKRELSSIITREITFDGVLVTLNQVDVTPDLKHAHAYVSVLGKEGQAAAMEKLEEHRVILQTALAKSVTLKYTPHLVFHLDDSIERGACSFPKFCSKSKSRRRRPDDRNLARFCSRRPVGGVGIGGVFLPDASHSEAATET